MGFEQTMMLVLVGAPALAGLLAFPLGRVSQKVRDGVCLLGCLGSAAAASYLFLNLNVFSGSEVPYKLVFSSLSFVFSLDKLNAISILFANILGALAIVYSIPYIRRYKQVSRYYALMLWTISSSTLCLLSMNYVPFLVFWALCTLWLFFAIRIAGSAAFRAAYKTILILASVDLAMILGVLLIVSTTHSLEIRYVGGSSSFLIGSIFILMLVGALAKAGGVPLHTWVPDLAADAPTTVVAYFPASLDKLLGIFKLTVICHILITFTGFHSLAVSSIGAITMLVAVLMALVQKDLKRLLAFHTVSQVGYMILGIGIGTPLGIAGGLFHMINNCMFKTCLFFSGGAAQLSTGTKDLTKLGGLARRMPFTFVCALIAALAISGVPPLNGFASKWMIYSAALEATRVNPIYLMFAVAAVITSTLTLASFVKYIHGAFLGATPKEFEVVKEVSWWMRVPMMILAAGCILFGVFPFIPLQYIILPGVQTIAKVLPITEGLMFPIYTEVGVWGSALATGLILLALTVGFIFYLAGRRIQPYTPTAEADKPFLGGEDLAVSYDATQFYAPLKRALQPLYAIAERGGFDLLWFYIAKPFQKVFKQPRYAAIAIYVIWLLVLLAIIGVAV